jgi:hypothetical protein
VGQRPRIGVPLAAAVGPERAGRRSSEKYFGFRAASGAVQGVVVFRPRTLRCGCRETC